MDTLFIKSIVLVSAFTRLRLRELSAFGGSVPLYRLSTLQTLQTLQTFRLRRTSAVAPVPCIPFGPNS